MAPWILHYRLLLLAQMLAVLVMCLSACGGGGENSATQTLAASGPPAPSAPAEPTEPSFSHGHFMGDVTIADETYNSEALVTIDGAVRIYIGGPADGTLASGAFPATWLHPRESMLFVGSLDSAQVSASGAGAVIGQLCDGASARFCDEPARAEVLLTSTSDGLTGELVIMTGNEEERWGLDLSRWSSYYSYGAGPLGEYRGSFTERLAPFAQAEDMTLEFEPGGRMSFASAVSGCTGNGTVAPHLDGRYDVHDVHLQITGCNAQFAYLNYEFEGLATETQSGAWDYDLWLVIFLAAPDGPPPRPAVTMRAYLGESSESDSGSSEAYWDY